jgi:hypothetical protein
MSSGSLETLSGSLGMSSGALVTSSGSLGTSSGDVLRHSGGLGKSSGGLGKKNREQLSGCSFYLLEVTFVLVDFICEENCDAKEIF